jgi:hypothetical protein
MLKLVFMKVLVDSTLRYNFSNADTSIYKLLFVIKIRSTIRYNFTGDTFRRYRYHTDVFD